MAYEPGRRRSIPESDYGERSRSRPRYYYAGAKEVATNVYYVAEPAEAFVPVVPVAAAPQPAQLYSHPPEEDPAYLSEASLHTYDAYPSEPVVRPVVLTSAAPRVVAYRSPSPPTAPPETQVVDKGNLEAQYRRLLREREADKAKIRQLVESLHVMKGEKDALQVERDQLSRRLDRELHRISQQVDQLEGRKHEGGRATAIQLTDLQEANRRLVRENERRKQETDRLSDELQKLQHQNATLREQARSWKQNQDLAVDSISMVQSLTDERDRLESQVAKLLATLKAKERSASRGSDPYDTDVAPEPHRTAPRPVIAQSDARDELLRQKAVEKRRAELEEEVAWSQSRDRSRQDSYTGGGNPSTGDTFGMELRMVDDPDFPGGIVMVRSVVHASPAERAGVRAGDLVLRWNGRAVRSEQDIFVRARPDSSAPVDIEVDRNGHVETFHIVVDSRSMHRPY
eukprot:TRINITY_DN16615_c0_g1_i1.p1 TRINITY_DN16615_c0_g1~~TRINITY_DN16615_c0_g1_i1.p1  ORF type:complete len:457 (+),score=62.12 TRINITY_DN16615_c0_g1_i1:51-1421(+)